MIQTFPHTVISRMIQNPLGPVHGHGTLACEDIRNLNRSLQRLVFRLQHLAHESDPRCLLRQEWPRAHAHVFDPAKVAYDLWKTRERTEIGGDADVDFLDGEARRGGAEADVGAGGDVDGDAVGYAVEDADDGYGYMER